MAKKKTSKGVQKWTFKTVPIDSVKPFDSNPRLSSIVADNALAESIKRFGYVEPVVWNERTGRIIGGHQRYNALVAGGAKEIKVVAVDMDENEELAANLTLNNPEVEGDWIADAALHLLSDVQGNDSRLFSALSFENLQADLEKVKPKQEKKKTTDTQCPCCGNEFKLGPDDVRIEEKKEQENEL